MRLYLSFWPSGIFQQFSQPALPEGRHGMCSVAARAKGSREHIKFGVFDAFYTLFDELEFWRIDYIIYGVDGGERNLDFFQLRIRVVISGGINIVEHIV